MNKRRSPFVIGFDDVPNALIMPPEKLKDGNVTSKMIYGTEGNFMIATREGGYHSTPHRHDSEQLNYVASGEIWIFVENDGFVARERDFFRIPRNAVHWSWIRSDAPCTLIESHVPPMTGDAGNAKAAVGLFAPGEDQSGIKHIATEFVDLPEMSEIEQRVIAAEEAWKA